MRRILLRDGVIGGGRALMVAAGLFLAHAARGAAEVSGPLEPTATRGAFTVGQQLDFYTLAFGAAVLLAVLLLAWRSRGRRERVK